MKSVLPLFAVACLLTACGENKTADAAATDAAATTEASAPAAPAADAAAPAADGAQVSTGVPECDEYVNKVMACVRDHIPEAQRAMIEQGINQTRSSWAAVSDKAQLANACRTAMDQAKASYAAMGCSF